MKKILPPLLPALALLTLGGCASSSYLTTTENDGMYYSAARDRVTAPEQHAAATYDTAPEEAPAAAPGDVANPDYAGTTGSTNSSRSEYYDDDYYYASRLRRFHSPYRGIGMGYYDFAYTDPYWYGGPAIGYSPWGFGNYYDPFFSPWGYGGVNINIGFGRPWYRPFGYGYGYGYNPYDYYGWGNSWGNPWGGYNYGYYNGYYNGLYNGYYGGGWGGNGWGGNGWGGYYDRPGRRTTYGARRDRATDGPGVVAPNGGSTGGRGRVQEGGFAGPGSTGGTASGVVGQPNAGGGRRRVQELDAAGAPTTAPAPQASTGRTRFSGDQAPQAGQLSSPAGGDQAGARRWRVLDNTTTTAPAGEVATPPTTEPTRRRRFEYGNNGGSNTSPDQQASQPRTADQPRRQRLFDSSAQPSQPSQPTRTYSEPTRAAQPSRSYSEPSRSYSEPSRSSSNWGGSNGGGGNSGGGNSGGGGGRRGRVQ
ncbi:hypothetical protein [Hymenobacter metallilatus]|uniref:Prolyl-tRNA synthetase n=1 Tax=Hymenobacter metallilatus TaxID=2493666 RepID=A0A428JFZ7_9BACT|nr:hypothetical protein [Hymenobacter metallilatus]RSK31178.1 hypothetical protein EI290_14245 [Hymenobacter metallilatus]